MVKVIVIESDLGRGIKLPGGKTINNGKPIKLAGREIFKLFTKKVKVFELVDGGATRVRLTPENYLDNHGAVPVAEMEEYLDKEDDDFDDFTEDTIPPTGDELPPAGETLGDEQTTPPVENEDPKDTETDEVTGGTEEDGEEELVDETPAVENPVEVLTDETPVLTEDGEEELVDETPAVENPVETLTDTDTVLNEDAVVEEKEAAAPAVAPVAPKAAQQYKKRNK